MYFDTPKVGKGEGRKFSPDAPVDGADAAVAVEVLVAVVVVVGVGFLELVGFGRAGRSMWSVGRKGGLVLVGPG